MMKIFQKPLKDRILNSVYNLFTPIEKEYIKQNNREFGGAMYKLTNYFITHDIENNDLSKKTLYLYCSMAQKDVNIRENNSDGLEDKMVMAITNFENYNNVRNSLQTNNTLNSVRKDFDETLRLLSPLNNLNP